MACLILTGCQGVNDVLSGVNSALGTVNSVLGSPSSSSSSSSSRVYIDSQTQQSVVNAANKATANNDAKKLFNDARPTIEKMIADAACNANSRQMEKYADPDKGFGYVSPFIFFNHHKSGCAHVLRINNIKKKTANAFSFNVYYMSPQSEETRKEGYTAIKQPSGEWLFGWAEY
ncbi:hypothetical protein BMT54_11095 [Pasteurellaceae bacterium 15-036681]|nr:hypothetical protein BMT54_11095 [Pasteurellaceae bacterium 15-036681]